MKSVAQSNHVVINKVPPDYYQRGIRENILQRIWHTGKLNAVTEILIGCSVHSILDVGCASGWFLSSLSKSFPDVKNVVGVDVYDKAIAYAKKNYPGLSFRVADAHRLPFQKEKFDTVICLEVLEHVNDPEVVLEEMSRVLKPGGQAVVEMDTGNTMFSVIWWLWRKTTGQVWEEAHIQAFNKKKLEKLLRKNGFRIEREMVFNFTMAVAFLIRKK